MKADADKCHLLTSSNEEWTICIDNGIIINSKCGKLLGVKINQKLNFNPYIIDICKKVVQKLTVFSRLTPYIYIPRNVSY